MRSFFLFLALLCSSYWALAQNTVSGTVTAGDDGSPLPGVSVAIKGTQRGTTTDMNGNFALNAEASDILVFSFIGFQTQEVTVGTQTNLQIVLSVEATALTEVVVVGYGEQKKSDITGSIARVDNKEIVRQPALTATQALQGKLPGVQIVNSGAPGSAPQVRVRGTGTLLGGADPLYVVDGMLTNDIRNINPSDIATIDVLKDASSAAIYGVRGANGVIIITTKAGEKGKMNVNYDAFYGVRQINRRVDMADSRLFIEYSNEAAAYDNVNPLPFNPSQASTNTDWLDAITRTGSQQNHTLTINGGSEKATYLVSAGYFEEKGILNTNDYRRINVRLNNTYQLTDFLKVGNNLNVSNYRSENAPFSAFTTAYRQAPVVPVRDANGNYGFTTRNNVGNPVATLDNTNDRSYGTRLQGSVFGELTLLKDLKFRTNFGMDADVNNGRVYNPVFFASPTQRNDISSLSRGQNQSTWWVWDNTLTYSKMIGDKHDFRVLVGTTAERFQTEGFSASRQNVPPQERYWYLNLGNEATMTNGGGGDLFTRNSYIGRLNYAYDGKYLFTATFRADGSSKFPTSNRWGYFPALGLGWRVSDEAFLQDVSWINSLKIRGSWGRIGNDAIPTNSFIYTISSGFGYPFGNNSAINIGSTITDIKDVNLQWEVTTEINAGIEYRLFGDKIFGEIDFYDKLTTDVLMFAPIDAIFGDGDNAFLTNKADIRNRGVEISVNWQQELANGLSYRIGAVATMNQNKIENIAGALPITGGGLGNGEVTTRTQEGQPIGSFWVYETDGIFQNQSEIDNYPHLGGTRPGDFRFKDLNGDNVINELDRKYVGSYQPKLFMGLNGGVNFKGFDLSLDTYLNAGNKIYNGKKAQRFGNENIEADLAGRWTPTNPSNTIPRASNAIPKPSTYFVESGTFFRVNNVTLGYTLPASLLDAVKVRSVRFYLSAQNPIIWQQFSGFTPELPAGTLDSGIELNAYPTSATYLVGLNVGF